RLFGQGTRARFNVPPLSCLHFGVETTSAPSSSYFGGARIFESYLSFHHSPLCRDLRPDSLEGFVHSKDRGMAAPLWESATDALSLAIFLDLLRYLSCRDFHHDSLEGFVHSKDRGMAAPSWESATDGIPTAPLGQTSLASGGASSQQICICKYGSTLCSPFLLGHETDPKLLVSSWTSPRSKPSMAAPSMESATGK
ncbi:hypothetical protein CVT26_002251, partial [Gymnopilus dilepis]